MVVSNHKEVNAKNFTTNAIGYFEANLSVLKDIRCKKQNSITSTEPKPP